MKNLVVIIDNGHGKNTPGKCAPDKSLFEWEWTREIAVRLYKKLLQNNIEAQLLVPEEKDIALDRGTDSRIKRTNRIVKEAKAAGKECVLLSVHINAAGGDGKWKTASGWSGWVANCASQKSILMAQLLYNQAEAFDLKGNRSVPSGKYWEANFAILRGSNCPAVLTENMFQDNKQDVQFLNSEEGKDIIVQLHYNAILEYIEKA